MPKAKRSSALQLNKPTELLEKTDPLTMLELYVIPHLPDLLMKEVEVALSDSRDAGLARARLFDRLWGNVRDTIRGDTGTNIQIIIHPPAIGQTQPDPQIIDVTPGPVKGTGAQDEDLTVQPSLNPDIDNLKNIIEKLKVTLT